MPLIPLNPPQVLGVVLFALGMFILLDGRQLSRLMDGGLFSVCVMILVVGFVIALISFLGCCGAAKKNSCLLLLVSQWAEVVHFIYFSFPTICTKVYM